MRNLMITALVVLIIANATLFAGQCITARRQAQQHAHQRAAVLRLIHLVEQQQEWIDWHTPAPSNPGISVGEYRAEGGEAGAAFTKDIAGGSGFMPR